MHVCVAVAHPDDEALYLGGTIARLVDGGATVTVVCLTGGADSERSREFAQWTSAAGVRGLILDYPLGPYEKLPAYPEEVDAALFREKIEPTELACVISHSPHGNENRHYQHVHTWRAMRNWCRAHSVPLGFFAERPLTELPVPDAQPDAGGAGLRAWRARVRPGPVLSRSLRRIAVAMREPKSWLAGAARGRLAWQIRRIAWILEVDVETAGKTASIEAAYSAQKLATYRIYHADREYLYLPGGAGESVIRALS